ncbi:MAG: alpha/beta hydrolase [Pseudomonadota bacterium]
MKDADDAYANAPYIPDGDSYPSRWAAAAAAFRAATPGEVVRYGPSARQVYEYYTPQIPTGTLIFVHGGYWRMTDPSVWSHVARDALGVGWACALPGYDLCPQVRIAGITQQVAQAIMAIADRSEGPLVLMGHSAGGHLVARMCAPGMLPAAVMARVQRVVPISPLSDLAPLMATLMNDDFQLDAGMARAESPRFQPRPEVPVIVRVGGGERPAFLDQAQWLEQAWTCRLDVVEGAHHYDIIEDISAYVSLE